MRHCGKNETDRNALVQYGRRNNVILSGIPDSVSDDTLEVSVITVLTDIGLFVKHQNIEACCRFGKPGR